MATRQLPNIIITGTPGVGKTSHSEILAEKTGLRHLSVNQVVKDQECHEGWSEEFQSWIVDEDKLLDAIEDDVKAGGYIIDWHACDLFPQSWIDLVVVLRAGSATLYDRLTARKVISFPLFPPSLSLVAERRPSWVLLNILTPAFRKYSAAKLEENLDSEIMEVLLQEAREAFDGEMVIELSSNSLEEMDNNVDRIEGWVDQWKKDNTS